MDASRQTTRISANVSGLLGTERITLNDNLLRRASLPEIEAVMGHEIGHYVLHHIYQFIVFFALVIALGFAVLRRGSPGPRGGGASAGGPRHRRSGGLAAAHADLLALPVRPDAGPQHLHPDERGRGRHLRAQRRTPAGRLRADRPQARRIPQARSRAGGGAVVVRSPERPGPDPDGDAVEGPAAPDGGSGVR